MRMPQRILNAWRGQRHSLIFPLNIIFFVLENGAVEKLSLTNSLDWSVVRIPIKLSYTLCQNISWVSAAQKPSLSRVWSGADATALIACLLQPWHWQAGFLCRQSDYLWGSVLRGFDLLTGCFSYWSCCCYIRQYIYCYYLLFTVYLKLACCYSTVLSI